MSPTELAEAINPPDCPTPVYGEEELRTWPMADARQFSVEFFRKWQPIINFVVPTEMVADLEEWVRVLMRPGEFDMYNDTSGLKASITEAIGQLQPGDYDIGPFDGSTGTPPSGQAGYASPPVPGTQG